MGRAPPATNAYLTTIFDHFLVLPWRVFSLLRRCVNSRRLGREKAKYARNRENCPWSNTFGNKSVFDRSAVVQWQYDERTMSMTKPSNYGVRFLGFGSNYGVFLQLRSRIVAFGWGFGTGNALFSFRLIFTVNLTSASGPGVSAGILSDMVQSDSFSYYTKYTFR